ncbi:hypothetical protein [Campylobacter concisus]|nr:hypothetical protein [Campylobacter concisus]
MASGFLRRALNLKEQGAKFRFKFKVADLKCSEIYKSAKVNKFIA